MTPDYWAKWPDDYMCPWDELDWEITHGRSDDVERIIVLSYDETGSPAEWVVA